MEEFILLRAFRHIHDGQHFALAERDGDTLEPNVAFQAVARGSR
jgi:hypothetical protein